MEVEDYSKIYQERQKKYRPFAYAFFGDLLILVVGLLIMIKFGADVFLLQIFGFVMMLGIFVSGILLVPLMKCPKCKKFMGRDIGKFCAYCGVRILPDKK
jgi:hypothetical protein